VIRANHMIIFNTSSTTDPWRHFRSLVVWLPVAPHRSPTNANWAVPIYYSYIHANPTDLRGNVRGPLLNLC
jgi:hypothetical protein